MTKNKIKKKICILKLGVGNCISIKGRLEKLGYKVKISSNLNFIKESNVLIIPGVGSSTHMMKKIEKKKLKEHIQKYANNKNKKIIGLCAGMQILGKSSEEGGVKCLSLIDSNVEKLKNLKTYQIPNIGFRKIINPKKYFNKSNIFYFNHSYEMKLNITNNVESYFIKYFKKKILAMFIYKNIYGIQFHPERSGESGLKLLSKII